MNFNELIDLEQTCDAAFKTGENGVVEVKTTDERGVIIANRSTPTWLFKTGTSSVSLNSELSSTTNAIRYGPRR
jgi:hypothetical protein